MFILLPLFQFGVCSNVFLKGKVWKYKIWIHRFPRDGVFVAITVKISFERTFLVRSATWEYKWFFHDLLHRREHT